MVTISKYLSYYSSFLIYFLFLFTEGDEYHPIRHWRQGLPGTHLSNVKITAENSRIIVPETGLYYLYSQAGFLIYYDNEQAETDSTQSLFHTIYRYNAIYPIDGNEELMRSVITQCWEKQKDYGRYTSYVGAAVKLHKGDQLYVKVSRIQDVAQDASRTYFGMFKLWKKHKKLLCVFINYIAEVDCWQLSLLVCSKECFLTNLLI